MVGRRSCGTGTARCTRLAGREERSDPDKPLFDDSVYQRGEVLVLKPALSGAGFEADRGACGTLKLSSENSSLLESVTLLSAYASWTSSVSQRGSEGRSARRVAPGVSWPTSCAREDWRNRKGGLASARRILPKLARKLGIALPPPQERMPQKAPTRDFPVASLRLGGGRRSHAGADVRGTGSGGETHPGATTGRTVTGSCRPAMADWAAFCAASWQARDEFAGWSADARVANLEVNRFLLLPGVHELASRVLGLAATRLPGDWEAARASGLHLCLSRPALLSCGGLAGRGRPSHQTSKGVSLFLRYHLIIVYRVTGPIHFSIGRVISWFKLRTALKESGQQ